MTRPYHRLHGHTWGLPGIRYRPGEAKPFYVRYERNYRHIHVGCYTTLREAIAAATAFLANEKATPLCPPPSPAPAIPIAKPSSTAR